MSRKKIGLYHLHIGVSLNNIVIFSLVILTSPSSFVFIESGVTSWGLGNYKKSRKLWQLAMSCTKYDFEYRMAVRLSLSLSKCDEIGVPHIDSKEIKGSSTNGRKRMPILSTY